MIIDGRSKEILVGSRKHDKVGLRAKLKYCRNNFEIFSIQKSEILLLGTKYIVLRTIFHCSCQI